ncbi:MAG: hypothetical protein ACOYOA_12635 [Saprospiraceae bacterium]
MEIRPFKQVNREFELELPRFERMNEYLDFILDKVENQSKDLEDEDYFVGKRWLEVNESDQIPESVLHFFNDGGEYLISINGNIQKGVWRLLKESNSIITECLSKNELYELAFLNEDFFILKKHGNHNNGQKRYLVMGKEESIKDMKWTTVMDKIFNIYRSSSQLLLLVIIAILVFAIIAFFTFY